MGAREGRALAEILKGKKGVAKFGEGLGKDLMEGLKLGQGDAASQEGNQVEPHA